MNEHIEEFKRFATAYFRWSHFNMDRIVADIIKRDKEAEDKRKLEIMVFKLPEYDGPVSNFNFERDVAWGTMKIPPGTVI